jgi:catechol 2,3-dioxygenase-like lactoylglutathione lyase family enzyme
MINENEQGEQFVRTPDGYFIQLVDSPVREQSRHQSPGVKSQPDSIQHISLHVTNVTSACRFYQQVLGANVVVNDDTGTAMCTWDQLPLDREPEANTDIGAVSVSHVGVQLHALPADLDMEQGTAQGRFAIETDDAAVADIAVRARQSAAAGVGKVVHGPVKLEPHGEEVVIVADEDGHEYCFVDARGFQQCVDVAKRQSGSGVDWEYRRQIDLKASADYMGDRNFGPHIQSIEARDYTDFLAKHAQADIILDLYAPWCFLCGKRKPIYQELARRVTEVGGGQVVFAMMDPTTTPLSVIDDDTLRLMLTYAKSTGYPMVFYLRAGERGGPEEFTGDWDMGSLRAWVEAQSAGRVDLSAMDMSPMAKAEGTGDADEEEDDDDDCDKCAL